MPSDPTAPTRPSPRKSRLPHRGTRLLCLALAIGSCSPADEGTPPATPERTVEGEHDLLWITVRGLRADLLEQGAAEGSLPELAMLRERSERWTRCFVPSVESAASVASVLTGKFPWEHGLRLGLATELPQDEETLFERAKAVGVPSAAVLCDLRLGRSSGLCQGLSEVDLPLAPELRWSVIGEGAEAIEERRSVSETVSVARGRAAAMAVDGRSSILWVALELQAFLSPTDPVERLRETYAQELRGLSKAVGELREAFEAGASERRATLVLCGSCGLLLGEDDRFATERSLDDAAVHVPCWIAALYDPEAVAASIEEERSLVDLATRLGEAIGVETTSGDHGPVLFEALRGSFEADLPPRFGGFVEGRRWSFPESLATQPSLADHLAPVCTGAFAAVSLDSASFDERLARLRAVADGPRIEPRAAVPALERWIAWDGPARGLLVPEGVDAESFRALDPLDGRALELWLAASLGDLVRRERLRQDVRTVLGPRAQEVRAAAESLPLSPLVAILAGLPTLAPFSAKEDRLRLGRRACTLAPWSLNANRTLADALARNGDGFASRAILESYLQKAPLSEEARAEFERRLHGR